MYEGRKRHEERLRAEADKKTEEGVPVETVPAEEVERAVISDGSEGPVVEVIRKKASPEESETASTEKEGEEG